MSNIVSDVCQAAVGSSLFFALFCTFFKHQSHDTFFENERCILLQLSVTGQRNCVLYIPSESEKLDK